MSTTVDASLRESDRREWQRHPVDVARLTVRLVLLVLVVAVTAAFPTALTDISTDLIEMFARIPTPVRYLLVGVAQLAILIMPIVTVVWLFTRRTRAATFLVVGAGVAGGLVMLWLTDWLNRAAPPTPVAALPSDWFIASDFPSIAYLAALVAGTTAASPMMTAPWRRVAWIAIAVTSTVRMITATQVPVSILVTLVLGSASSIWDDGTITLSDGAPTRDWGVVAAGVVMLQPALNEAGKPIIRDHRKRVGPSGEGPTRFRAGCIDAISTVRLRPVFGWAGP